MTKELTDKSYWSTENLWYYSLNLYALNRYNKGTLPYPESIVISKASESDLNIFRENWSIGSRFFFGDKIYYNEPFFEGGERENGNPQTKRLRVQKSVF